MAGTDLVPMEIRAVTTFVTFRVALAKNLIALISFGYRAFPSQIVHDVPLGMRPRVTCVLVRIPLIVSLICPHEFACGDTEE